MIPPIQAKLLDLMHSTFVRTVRFYGLLREQSVTCGGAGAANARQPQHSFYVSCI